MFYLYTYNLISAWEKRKSLYKWNPCIDVMLVENTVQWESVKEQRTEDSGLLCVLYPLSGPWPLSSLCLCSLYCVTLARAASCCPASPRTRVQGGQAGRAHSYYPLLVYCPLIVHQWAGPPGPAAPYLRLTRHRLRVAPAPGQAGPSSGHCLR